MFKRKDSELNRRSFLKRSVAAGAVGIGPVLWKPDAARAASGLAPGMTGGPVGFPGAEAYQYNESHSEGRAIEGLKKLRAEGNAPDKLVIMVADGAIGHFTKPFPEGAPTVKETFENETGIELEIIGVPVGETFPKVMQDITTNAGVFDVYQIAWNNIGDYADIGGIIPLDDFVEKYQPDFNDPERGYVGADRGVELLAKYDGKGLS